MFLATSHRYNFAETIKTKGASASDPSATPKEERPTGSGFREFPASYGQKRFWLLYKREGPTSVYNLRTALRLEGQLDERALRIALDDVVERHESLRTTVYEKDDRLVQRIVRHCPGHRIMHTWHGSDGDFPQAFAEAGNHHFVLERELPFKAHLFRLAADQHVLLLLLHHMAGDGWSLGNLVRDVAAAYSARVQGRKPRWMPLPMQYGDYALAQIAALGDESDPASIMARQLAFWRETLANLPAHINLPFDRPRPPVPSFRGDRVDLSIDPPLYRKLGALARESKASLFMVLQAGLAVALTGIGAGTDLPVCNPVSGRNEQVKNLVGVFINTLVLRFDTSGNPTFRQMIARVRAINVAAHGNRELPFVQILSDSSIVGDDGPNVLSTIMLVFQSSPPDGEPFWNLRATREPIESRTAKFDLYISLTEDRQADDCGSVRGAINFSTDVFDRSTMEKIAETYLQSLRKMVDNPDAQATTTPGGA